jgi:hypothetical protein
MKISYDAFIQAIWTYQLKALSKGVLHRYIGDKYSVVGEAWYRNATSIHTCERGFITEKLGKQQAYKRIRTLIEDGYVKWAHKDCTFFIDTKQSKDAFNFAREFWLSKNIPTGYEDGRAKCVLIENHEQLIDECFEQLQSKYKSVDWIELLEKEVA